MFILKTFFQVCLLCGATLLGNTLVQLLHLHVPGSIFGILLVFILLETKILRVEWIEAGANLLIADLLLFFIPSAVGVIQYKQLMLASGVRFELVIILSTATVMICTGMLVEFVNKVVRE